jgi:hypothetical protein
MMNAAIRLALVRVDTPRHLAGSIGLAPARTTLGCLAGFIPQSDLEIRESANPIEVSGVGFE